MDNLLIACLKNIIHFNCQKRLDHVVDHPGIPSSIKSCNSFLIVNPPHQLNNRFSITRLLFLYVGFNEVEGHYTSSVNNSYPQTHLYELGEWQHLSLFEIMPFPHKLFREVVRNQKRHPRYSLLPEDYLEASEKLPQQFRRVPEEVPYILVLLLFGHEPYF